MNLRFHPQARKEYLEAITFYAERQPGLQVRFADAVEEAVRKIINTPERWLVVEGSVRRCRTRVFPYAVLYAVESKEIVVLAVMHGSRRPGYWRSRFPGGPAMK